MPVLACLKRLEMYVRISTETGPHARARLSNFVLCGKLQHRLIRILFRVENCSIG